MSDPRAYPGDANGTGGTTRRAASSGAGTALGAEERDPESQQRPYRGRRRRSPEDAESDRRATAEPRSEEPPLGRRRRASTADAPAEETASRRASGDATAPDARNDGERDDAAELGIRLEEERAPRRSRSSRSDRSRPPSRKRKRGRGAGGRRAARRKKRGRAFAPVVAILVLVLIVGGGGALGYTTLRSYIAPPDYEGSGSGEVTVVIEEGDSGEAVGETLHDAGVVASVRAFTNALRVEGGGELRPGKYRLRSRMSADAAVEMLGDPASRVGARITLREGLRLGEIFEEITAETDVSVEELRAVAEEPEQLDLPAYADGRLDGYLFPETYTVGADVTAAEILGLMVDQFRSVADEMNLRRRAEDVGMTPSEIMAVAAIIQAETGGAEDMPKISRVVYNRLDAGMELGMDSTCFYVIDEYGIALTEQQLRECENADSEYATYGRQGLPPGPIVSPGREAIDAALEPAEGDWLFFVATDPENGVTEFAETEEEFWDLKERFDRTREGS